MALRKLENIKTWCLHEVSTTEIYTENVMVCQGWYHAGQQGVVLDAEIADGGSAAA
jgi:hypothetical protein